MYKSYFGLRDNPFSGNPDPRFLCLLPQTQKALAQLKYGVQCGRGLILLTGEVGTGKTTLINYLLNWLRARNTPTAFIFNPHLTVNHLLDFILTDFGVPIDFRLNGNMLMRLNLWLMEQFRAGRKPVLIVDEAQGLSTEALEEIRLLLNLEADANRLLQIVLVGQPELEAKLKRPELSQLRQRIESRSSTVPLRLAESHAYISERLRIAGASGNTLFPAETIDLAHFYSKGIPRVLNLLCEHALINTFAAELAQVPPWAVEEAALDFLLTDICSVGVRHRVDDLAKDSPRAMDPKNETDVVLPIAAVAESSHNQNRPSAQSLAVPATFAIQQRVSAAGAIPPGFTRALIGAYMFAAKLRTRLSATIQRNGHLAFLARTLRSWVFDFGRDWKCMMKAIDFSTMVKPLSHWLRNPASTKRMSSSRKHAV